MPGYVNKFTQIAQNLQLEANRKPSVFEYQFRIPYNYMTSDSYVFKAVLNDGVSGESASILSPKVKIVQIGAAARTVSTYAPEPTTTN
jgi:hypothetical protein